VNSAQRTFVQTAHLKKHIWKTFTRIKKIQAVLTFISDRIGSPMNWVVSPPLGISSRGFSGIGYSAGVCWGQKKVTVC
jgi:hypothetical protein